MAGSSIGSAPSVSSFRVSEDWRGFRVAAAVCAAAAIGVAVFGLVDAGGQRLTRAVTDGSFVVFSVFAAVASARTARRRERPLPWLLLAGAAACYAVGNSIWFYYQVLAPERQTYPGPADIFYVAVIPFAVTAMLVLPSRPLSTAARARAIADGLLIGVALLFISWILVVGPLVDQLGEADRLYLTVYLYYPLTDIVIISMAIVLATRASGRERYPMLLVGAGFIAIACADTGISYLALQGEEAAGSGLDLGWTVGYMLLGLAALTPVWHEAPEDRADPRALVREPMPYVPVAAAAAFALSNPSRLTDAVLVVLFVAVLILLVVRHLLTLAENVRLTSHLEDLVRERTHNLERVTRRQQSILEGAAEGIVGLDHEGRVSFGNPAAGTLLGRSPSDLIGVRFHDVARPRDDAFEPIGRADDPIERALVDGQVHTLGDVTYQRADGTIFDVELTVAPIHGPEGRTGGVLLFRDVTERRAVDRIKDEFVSVVSHELRTPLASLRGALGLLQSGRLREAPVQAERMVDIAVESTDRLIRLINDILDVERLAAGKFALHRQACSAAQLIDRAVSEMRALAHQASVDLQVRAATGVVDADPDRIVQTLTNLLSNAIKFSPASGTIRIGAHPADGEVAFSVRDEGVGIPPDLLESIFGRFYQVDSSDTRERAGTGLGLAISRGIVEQHGGRLWAESELGHGATLRFTLPALETASPDTTQAAAPEDGSAPTVLVCDDDPQIRVVVSEVLRTHGYSVVSAASAEEALACAAEQTPAAVLMDLALPGMDGWAAIRALRADAHTRDVPVLIVSGTQPGDTPADVAGWVTKPLDVSDLLTALNAAIGERAPRPCVLIVEDDPTLTRILVALFEKHDVTAVPAHTARDGLRLSHDIAPDLVLLDLMMPDTSGFTFVDWLRQDPRLCRIPLVVYSALDLDEQDKERLRLGPTEFFTKTRTDPEEVERQVLKLLDTVVAGAVR